ncbi:protein kinase [Coleofasciculus sp. FACHB-129]|uniref:serine/threonine protein kinase n=1 Tax=Cyanophyceae TaxID=3028117 RepID=UPI0016838530|nr:protein kinase [Coleofasciculus sp. FACHB-129]MBD1896039.1 protein kinase [Coleofasciculus sp. FACHB-129]
MPLHEGAKTVIYQGNREAEQTSVSVKAFKAEYPALEEIFRLRHEYKILLPFDIEEVVKSLALENYNNGLALVLEYFDGKSLEKVIKSPLKTDLNQFIPIAIQLADTLAALHQNQIIHKDIKPHNILMNSKTGQVKIIDFSISSRLSRERAIPIKSLYFLTNQKKEIY